MNKNSLMITAKAFRRSRALIEKLEEWTGHCSV